MGWKLDIKSVVVGAVVVAVAAIMLGAAKSEPTVGRYQLAAGATRAFIVDTMTGQVWDESASPSTFLGPKIEGSK
jgi:hypothetical protein